jgi:exonuclease SbcD
VAAKPDVYTIHTASGILQVAALPWLRRSAVLTQAESKNLNLEQVRRLMEQKLTDVIANLAQKLDPALPALLAAHVWVTGAKVGSESSMSIGQEPVLLLSSVALPAFDYVALGHIHKRQALSEKPPVIYSGSLERVDFSEEGDEKGFYVIDIDTGDKVRKTRFEFHPVKARRFLTINIALKPEDTDPTTAVLNAIAGEKERGKDAIVRVNVNLPASMEGQLRNNDIRDAMKDAHYFNLTREVERESRLRLANRSTEELTPLAALKAWLETQKVPPERQKVLLEYGEKLVGGDGGGD